MSSESFIKKLVGGSKTLEKMPSSMQEGLQPTSESLQNLGEKYGYYIEQNEVMRNSSVLAAEERVSDGGR